MTSKRICIIGAGVIGLSCGNRLQEILGRGYPITIYANRFLQDTTSDVAAGSFRPAAEPSVAGYNGKRSRPGRDITAFSHERYKGLIDSVGSEVTGIHGIKGYDIWYPGTVDPTKEPFYTQILDTYRKVTPHELSMVFPALPEGCGGYYLDTFVVSPRTYMSWLTKGFLEAGGTIIKEEIQSFEHLFGDYDIVFNCTGLGATQLTEDLELQPNRGQTVRVDTGNKAKNTFVFILTGKSEMPYYVWTPDCTLIGGTKLAGDGSKEVSPEHHKMIMDYADTYFPWLEASEDKVVSKVVGHRPSRPSPRIEMEEKTYKGCKKWVIHNYGHCGHGVSMSWGSACLAVELATEVLSLSKM